MNGITFIMRGKLNPEAKEKLKKLISDRNKRLEKWKTEYQKLN